MRKDIGNQISMMKERDLMNKSELARRLNCNRRTVDNYLENQQIIRNSRKIVSILEEFKGTITDKVDTYGASSMSVFKFIQSKSQCS